MYPADYSRTTLRSDVCVIQLRVAVLGLSNMARTCLPGEAPHPNQGLDCFVPSWGYVSSGEVSVLVCTWSGFRSTQKYLEKKVISERRQPFLAFIIYALIVDSLYPEVFIDNVGTASFQRNIHFLLPYLCHYVLHLVL